MSKLLFTAWLGSVASPHGSVVLYQERKGARRIGVKHLKSLLGDHFVGEETILRSGGYPKAAALVANSLPTNKRTRSGDLGELLATEYVDAETAFAVPVKKLRWKSDRQMPMHGNDIIAIDRSKKPFRILKGECKSRAWFSDVVVMEAAEGLDKHDGRPNPSTLAFITKRLYEENRDDEAQVFRDLQTSGGIAAKRITHMIFAFSGNDPSEYLAKGPAPAEKEIKRENVGFVVADHADFIEAVFRVNGA